MAGTIMLGANMTHRARRAAFALGLLGALCFPKRAPCLAPGAACEVVAAGNGQLCTPTDLEPIGIFALEWITGDLGIHYRRWLDCS
jgi:hypothetical protein